MADKIYPVIDVACPCTEYCQHGVDSLDIIAICLCVAIIAMVGGILVWLFREWN